MELKDACTKDVVTISPTASLIAAAGLMRERHVGCLVVVEERTRGAVPVGIVTDRDIVVGIVARAADALDFVLVRDLAVRKLVTAKHDESLDTVIRRMRTEGVRRMPVIDDDGRLRGLIAVDDIIRVLGEQMQALAQIVEREQARETTERS